MSFRLWTRTLCVAAYLGLPLLAGCSQEKDVLGKSPAKIPTLPGVQHSGENDPGAGSTTTGGKH